MNIPIIELGFPAAGESEIEAIKKIGSEFKNSNTKTVFCVCARAIMHDIEMADKAISNYPYSRIQILMPSSDTHINATLNVSKTKVLEMTRNSIIKAKKYFDDIQFTAIDSLRSNKNFLSELILVAAEAGVNTISLPDSVGFATPYDYYTLVSDIKKVLLNYGKIIIATHCHNDLGLATANTLAGIKAGARQVECTVNGIGERAGNTSFEEVLMSIKVRNDIFPYKSNLISNNIKKTSKLVEKISKIRVQKNKAIVGDNAFMHASGIHQHAILKNAKTYQILNPKDIGINKIQLPLGKLSGKHAISERLKQLGVNLSSNKLSFIFEKFKEIAKNKKKFLTMMF